MADLVAVHKRQLACLCHRKKLFSITMVIVCGLSATLAASAQAFVRNRIIAPIRSDQTQAIPGSVSPVVSRAQDAGQLSGSTVISDMSLVFRLSAAQQKSLSQLLHAQQTKGSPMYHRWLGPGQFAASYGVSTSDLAKVAGWLQSQGFRVDAIPASSDRINFSGTAALVSTAFHTQMHRYKLNGKMQWANASNVSVPQAIAGMVLGIEHLNTFRPVPHRIARPVHARVLSASEGLSAHYTVQDGSGNELNFIAPSDSTTIYNVSGLYSAGITGKGQSIGVVGQTDILQYKSDIANFRSLSGLNAANMPSQILVPNSGTTQVYAGDLEEADIDTEWSGATAKDASIVYVTVGSDPNASVFDALQYAIQTPLLNNKTQFLPVISISYGACEPAFQGSAGGPAEVETLEQTLQEANAQGQTVVASSGDSGSADCDTGTNSSGQLVGASNGLAVDYPGSSQYVTAAGGSSFSGDILNQSKYWSQTNNSDNGSVLSYIPETTWNDTPNLTDLSNAGSLSASGGGASALFAKPSWQTGPGVPGDGKRDVPDLSLAADPNHDGYVLCTEETNSAGTSLTGTTSCVYPVGSQQVPYFDANSQGYLYGGTSIVAPQLAGMIALWNQAAGNTQGVGNINPFLYLTAQNTPGAFHDTTTGNNAVVCVKGSPNCNPDPTTSGNYIMSCCNAGSGYDTATGLGSVDAAAMAAVWPGVGSINQNFSMLFSPGAISVNPGSSAKATLVLTSNGFAGAVALACSSLPANVTCSFSPGASVTLSSDAVQNITVTVSASSAAQASHPLLSGWPMQTVFAGVFGLAIFGFGRWKRPFPSAWMAAFILIGGLMAAAALTACGSGNPSGSGSGSTPSGSSTSTITVTGTSGSSTASALIQLTIT